MRLATRLEFKDYTELNEFHCPEGFSTESVRTLCESGKPLGLLWHTATEDEVNFALWFEDADVSVRGRVLCLVCEDLMRKFHPKRLVIQSCDALTMEALKGHRFYFRNRVWVRRTEPWRRLVSDRVFDSKGLIINQSLMTALPFGAFNTKDKGCGWIAAFNLFKLCHHEKTMQEVAEGLSSTSLLGERVGQPIQGLMYYLRKNDLPVKIAPVSQRLIIKKMKDSSAGILMYRHKHGAHYAAYETLDNGEIRFYNSVYGRINDHTTPEDFFKQRVRYALAVVYIKEDQV